MTITMATSPSGLALTVDGGGCTAPCNYQWTQGSSHSIAASSPQNGAGGTQYLFASWSDGFAQSHSITASASATYTATFTPVSGGANLITNYSYDLYDNLTQVSMPRAAGTQTRTFVYNGKYLVSATNPENGTVTYTYTANQKIASKTDAKGQKIVYTYDASLRLTEIQRYPTPGNEDVCQRTLFYYDTNPFDGSFSQYSYGRPTATQYGEPSAGGVCNGVPYTLSDQYSYTSGGLVTKKRLAVSAHIGNPLTTVNLDTSQTYDNQGRVLTVSYPNSGPTYTYGYDTMDRPISLTDNQSVTWVNNVLYGLSSELLQIAYAGYGETRTYNNRLQLTSVGSMQYTYSATQNNGQIVKQNDLASGEEVTYTYDSLQRLIGAVTTDSSWGQAFTYDGFGNRTSASVTKGSAPYGNWIYDPATNRMGGYSYDANGNMTSVPGVSYGAVSYDVENRLVSVPTGSNPEQYAYAPDNKRVWRRMADGTEQIYFYGISGQKLGTYKPFIFSNGSFTVTAIDTNLYFGSRTIVSRGVTVQPDRLGSNRAGGSRYFPYGEEQQVTAQDRDKYATYYRDSTTGLDYAQNRYYASTLARFTSPDPFQAASAGPADPQSWNQYAYTRGDPVNRYDPSGLDDNPPGFYFEPPPGPNYWGGFAGPTTHSDWNEENQDQKGNGSFDATPNALKVLRELPNAIGLALKALANSDCSKLFSLTQDGLNPSYLLTQLSTGMSALGYFLIAPIPPSPGATTSATATPIESFVDIGNDASQKFGTGSVITINTLQGSFISGSLQDQAITILHELGHAFNQIYNAGGSQIKDDGKYLPDGSLRPNPVGISEANTALIKDNCFK